MVQHFPESPQDMDPAVQAHGRELEEMLRLFRQKNTTTLSEFGFPTPANKMVNKKDKNEKKTTKTQMPKCTLGKSSSLKSKCDKGKTIVQMAQELVAKKCGIIREEQEFDTMTLQQYFDMYKLLLTKGSRGAILKLTEVA